MEMKQDKRGEQRYAGYPRECDVLVAYGLTCHRHHGGDQDCGDGSVVEGEMLLEVREIDDIGEHEPKLYVPVGIFHFGEPRWRVDAKFGAPIQECFSQQRVVTRRPCPRR